MPLTYHEGAGQYRDARGRFVPREAVRRALDRELEAVSRQARALAVRVRDGDLTIAQWQAEMRGVLKTSYLRAAAAERGGWARMSQTDYGHVGQLLREQYQFLDRFAADIERGVPLDGRFLRRAEMYGQSARRAYHVLERHAMGRRGRREERNVLGVADHCEGCVAASAAGWVPLGTLPPPGSRTCLTRCKCQLVYR